jgi:hypothetical protein
MAQKTEQNRNHDRRAKSEERRTEEPKNGDGGDQLSLAEKLSGA